MPFLSVLNQGRHVEKPMVKRLGASSGMGNSPTSLRLLQLRPLKREAAHFGAIHEGSHHKLY